MSFDGSVEFQFAADGSPSNAKVEIVAYNGGKMKPRGVYGDLIIDLAELKATDRDLPMLRDHERGRILGHASARVSNYKILASGELSGTDEEVNEVISLARKNFPWRVSVGAEGRLAYVDKDVKVTINGAEHVGPFYVLKGASLQEISILAVAADMGTSAQVAASGDSIERYEMEQTPETQASTNATVNAGGNAPPTAPVVDIQAARAELSKALQEEALNKLRTLKAIEVACGGNASLHEKALAEGWSEDRCKLEATQAELNALKNARPQAGVAVHIAASGEQEASVVAAAILLGTGTFSGADVAKHYGDKIAEQADTRRNRTYSLKRLMHTIAATAGKSCPVGAEDDDFIRDVFNAQRKIEASGAASTLSLTGVLADVANKAMLASFQRHESVIPWFCAVRSNKDFKPAYSYRLEGKGLLEEIGADGEITHASLTDSDYSVALKTFAKMLGINRKMMINDDLGAFMQVNAVLGDLAFKAHEKAGIELLHTPGGSFYDATNSFDGSTSAFSMDSVQAAYNLFTAQVDTEGYPISVDPDRVLAPAAIKFTVDKVLNSEYIVSGNTTAAPDRNPVYGMLKSKTSPWLQSSKVTGATSVKWYMFADPAVMPAFVVAYLNGQRNPTIESSDMDFNKLGMQFRCFWDFNFGLETPQGVVKSKGSA